MASVAFLLGALRLFRHAGEEGFVWGRPVGLAILGVLSATACGWLVWPRRPDVARRAGAPVASYGSAARPADGEALRRS